MTRNTTRRELLRSCIGGASLILLSPAHSASARSSAAYASGQSRIDDDLFDTALEALHERAADDQNFLSNHVPMVIEALYSLGRAVAIHDWMDGHFETGKPGARVVRAIQRYGWREALGVHERYLDWRDFFLAELRDEDWTVVVRAWVPRFLPGLSGSATHGVIRTAHAVRSIGRLDNDVRRTELASALAYWASRYEELPWDKSIAPKLNVEVALASVELRQPALAPPRGNIVTGLRSLHETPSFHSVAGLVDTSDPSRTLSELTATMARVFVTNPTRRIHFTHAITAPSAVRLIAPHLDDESVELATRYAWQAAAGLYTVYHDPRLERAEVGALDRDELIDLAVTRGEHHGIKLTEACLREAALANHPDLWQAATDAAKNTRG